MFESRQESLELTMGNDARRVLTGMPRNGTGHRIPCDKCAGLNPLSRTI